METTIVIDQGKSPRGFLLSEPKALLQTIIPRDDDSDSEELPSTVDMDALKEPLLSTSDDPVHMGQWRNNATPRAKTKVYEVPKKDQQVPNGLETESHSERSRDSDGSSSESDSDSDSDSGSGSSTSESSCNSSGSSDSSDSDSDTPSNKSSCHSMSIGGKKLTTSLSSLSASKKQVKGTHSRSNSSTSSRSRKSKQFSISQSTYEPGSLKLKIAALKLPPMQHQQPPKTPEPRLEVVNDIGSASSKGPADKKSALPVKGPEVISSSPPVDNGSEKRTNTNIKADVQIQKHKELEKTPTNPRRSSRCSRAKSCGESPLNAGSTPVTNGFGLGSSLQCNSLPPKSESKRNPKEVPSRSSNLPEPSSSFPSVKESDKHIVRPSVPNKHRLTSSLNDTVTMTANNGFNITPKRNTRTPVSANTFHGMNSMYQIKASNLNGIPSVPPSEHNILDPVLRLTKNSDLTIFAINPPKANSNNNKPSTSSHHSWNNSQDLVMISTPGTGTPNANNQSSPLRSSRRLSAQRRSIDKSDFESWDSTDASAAVQAAIQRIDSEVINSSKLTSHLHSSNNTTVTNCTNISATNKKYNSSLLEKFTEMLTSPQGNNTSPKIGDVSIEPIMSSKPNSCINKSKSLMAGSQKSLDISNTLPHNDRTIRIQKDKQQKKLDHIEKIKIVPEAKNVKVKISRIDEQTKKIKISPVEKTATVNKTLKSTGKGSKHETAKTFINGNITLTEEPIHISRHQLQTHKTDSKVPITKTKSLKHKKARAKLGKLSIFVPMSRPSKVLRSNGKVEPQTNSKISLKINSREPIPLISEPLKLKPESKNVEKAKVAKEVDKFQKDTEIKTRTKSDCKTIQSSTITREAKGSSSNSKKDIINPVTSSNNQNGPVKPENMSFGQPSEKLPQTMPPMMKTKGAKKYIPENENHLVSQHVLPASSATVMTASSGSENKTPSVTLKKKSKKSRAKDKKDKDKNKLKKQKISPSQQQTLDDLCKGISHVNLKTSPPPTPTTSHRSNKKQNNLKKPRFTFEKITFKNIFTPLIPNNEIPPPPYDKLTKGQSRSQQNLRGMQSKASLPNSTPQASARKRKQGNERNSIGDSSDTTLSDSSSANTSSSELQRLPLKKRHHHATTGIGSSAGQSHISQESSFNFDEEDSEISKYISGNKSRYKFGARSILNTKVITGAGLLSTSAVFGQTSDFRQKCQLVDKNLTSGDKDKYKETSICRANLDFAILASEARLEKKQNESARKKTSGSGKKDKDKSPKVNNVLPSAEPPCEKRRSVRVRKPRILDGEILESPGKSSSVSPNKALMKPEIRELASKIEASITPVMSETTVLTAVPVPSFLLSTGTTVLQSNVSNVIEKNRKRLRSVAANERIQEEIPAKVPKLSIEHAAINGKIKRPPNREHEIITIEDDDDLVQIELENPDKQSGVEIIMTQTSVPMPLISPTSSTGVVKKRRKVNKTGFPAVKKKKKISVGGKLIASSSETHTPSTSGVESVDVDSDDVVILTEAPMPSTSSRRKKSSSRKGDVFIENQFSSSLTERVKIRKRISVDGNGSCDDGSDGLDIPGVSPALINIPDAPIIIPEKVNLLPAGLLSNFYKQNSVPTKKKAGRKPKSTDHILPPPAYCQQFVRQRVVDYTLPYDIWCLGVIRAKHMLDQWKEEQRVKAAAEEAIARENKKRRSSANTASTKPAKIPMPDIIPPSWHFKKIRTNVYFGLNKPPSELDVDQMCGCQPAEQKCSADDCLNRVVYSECPASCGETCTNRRIQKHDWAPYIKRVLTENKGYGVFTQERIKKGEFILEYVGEVVPDALFKERMHTIYANDTHHYCLQLDGGMVIDGHRAGGEGRFVNHSCEPNCEMQKWVVAGLSRMALFALRDIEPNEELSYDYNFSLFNPAEGQPCHCGSTKCRGVIGGRTKSLKDAGRPSKRKTKTNIQGIKDNLASVSEPSIDKMKVLTRKERLFIQKHKIFLVRNYYMIQQSKGDDKEDKVGHRLEKILTSWATRYKAGSSKIKPLILPEDEPELSRMARMSQILYILLTKLTAERDESDTLCSAFMTMPLNKKCPLFYEQLPKGQEPLDFTVLRKKILRGEYKTLSALETDIGIVLNTFCQAYEKDKPHLTQSVDKIKSLYVKLKEKAVAEIEPFIIVNGKASELPDFVKWEQKPEDDVIRCICNTYTEDGNMIQCDNCLVWQHADCVRVSDTHFNGTQDSKRRRKGKGKINESRSCPVTPVSSPFNGPKPKTLTPSTSTPQICQGEGKVQIEGLILSVKDELVMVTCEDNSTTDQDSATKNEVEDIKPRGSVSELPVSEMDTQRIDEEDLFSPAKPNICGINDVKTEIKNETSQQKENLANSITNEATVIEKASSSTPNKTYLCEKCNPREIDMEVPLEADHDTPEKKHFLCLKREDDLMLSKNDTVYVLRDSPPEKKAETEGNAPRVTYLTAGTLVPSECDIFRIESLWKDAKGGRFVFGYHYLRPNETFHEPSRRFYPNEILRAPLFEVISIDLIHGRCWVVDPATYCKGRPIGCVEEHLYICEYRVDKAARSFAKVGKNTQGICIKPFAFNFFENRLKIQRNLHPHGPPSPDFRVKPINALPTSGTDKCKSKKASEKSGHKSVPNTLDRLNINKKRQTQVERVRRVLGHLHTLVPSFKDPSNYVEDVSILHTGRKKSSKKFSSN